MPTPTNAERNVSPLHVSTYTPEANALGSVDSSTEDSMTAPVGTKFARIYAHDGDLLVEISAPGGSATKPDAGSMRVLEKTSEYFQVADSNEVGGQQTEVEVLAVTGTVQYSVVWLS